MPRLIIRHARQIVTICNSGERFLRGDAMKNVALLEGEDDMSLVVDDEGKIAAIGSDKDLSARFNSSSFDSEIDATGMCVLPGLIDGHTHPVWVGDRVHEFAMKLAGATYMDVHKAGGGIGFTVEHVRKASEEELYQHLHKRLTSMIKCGTTLVEAKSGYGLDAQTEIKMLKVLERAKKELPIEISSTFCGAHSIPKGSTMESATEDVINVQLPALKSLMNSGELCVENIDVFCEKGVFDVESSRQILKAGVDMGLHINFHGDELHNMHSAKLGAELCARAVSHLEEIDEEGIKELSHSETVAVLLPTTAYILRLTPPPARKMIEQNVIVALGSDFNPNAFCFSMPLVMHLACILFHMNMNEALIAATINAAASLGRGKTHGSLEVGKVGDIVVVDAPRWEHLIYQFGNHNNIIKYVIKNGQIIHSG